MNFPSIAHVIGILLIITGSSMALPISCSLYYQENDLFPFLYSALTTLSIGIPMFWFFRKENELNILDGSIPSFTDAFFEMISGYTTTGATILTDIEALPHGLLFWRSQTHLLGGMGLFDSLCTAFDTVSTSGYSPKNASMASMIVPISTG